MLFDDDHVLNLWGAEPGNAMFGAQQEFNVGEVIITGRVPGALYADDLSGGETFLEHILPLRYGGDGITSVDIAAAPDSGAVSVGAADQAWDEPSPANDDDAPAALPAAHGKDAEPLVLVTHDLPGQLDDPFDLAIPAMPRSSTLEAPQVVAPPSVDGDGAPVFFGLPYQSLSFLIIDTPFAVGDDQLPSTLRPPLNDLLGLGDDDGETWVLPLADRGAWLLG